jgi:hypothetical protein
MINLLYGFRPPDADYPPFLHVWAGGDEVLFLMREPPECSPFPAIGGIGPIGLAGAVAVPREEAARLHAALGQWLARAVPEATPDHDQKELGL